MKKIIIALDYNPTAQKIAEEGYALAKAMDAKVILLHVIEDPVYYNTTYSPIMGFAGYMGEDMLPIESIKELTNTSQEFLNRTKEHLGDAAIETEIREGDIAENILAAVDYHQADIIVMGSHSRKWLEKIIMGSNTEEVLQATQVPLFIIPTKA